MNDPHETKQRIRAEVWWRLEDKKVAAFPFPVRGRIPNFKDSALSASMLCASHAFRDAKVVKVNPDSPQRDVRKTCLEEGKTLVMPTPRIRDGFLVIKQEEIPRKNRGEAASIAGAMKRGRKTHPRNLPNVDLMVLGSVAVSPLGDRIGKGEGYAEIEYAILRMFGKVSNRTPIYTNVHELQIVDEIPTQEFDVGVDIIFTPKRKIETKPSRQRRPSGIIWEMMPEEKIKEIPILQELRNLQA